jgi:hypothetical protein
MGSVTGFVHLSFFPGAVVRISKVGKYTRGLASQGTLEPDLGGCSICTKNAVLSWHGDRIR